MSVRTRPAEEAARPSPAGLDSTEWSALPLTAKINVVRRAVRTLWARRFPDLSEGATVRIEGNAKFMSARDAAQWIPDDAVLGISGLGTNQGAGAMFHAVRQRYEKSGHPRRVTLVCVGGVGARGKGRGSVEEMARKGLITRFFAGHVESFKELLALGDAGHCEIQVVPQGITCLVLAAQAERGECFHRLPGLHAGTCVDPRVGRGTVLCPEGAEQHVRVDEETGDFVYHLPRVTVALLSAPAADRKGNIYNYGASTQSELVELSRAAKRHGGLVIVQVGLLVCEGYADVIIPGEMVDCVVVHHQTEQALGATHDDPYTELMLSHSGDTRAANFALAELALMNRLSRAVPVRTPADAVVGRLAAKVVQPRLRKMLRVQIGTGLPEEVARTLHASGVLSQLDMVVESGVFGGVAAPGAFFGAAVHPREMVSSAETFRRIYRELGIIVVGALEVDSSGSVNVTRKGAGIMNYVGPGGFIDLTTSADCVLFCTSLRNGMRVALESDGDGGARVKVPAGAVGKPTFVPEVAEVSFSGPQALKRGQRVYYVCHAAAFVLTKRGLELLCVAPGVDYVRDVAPHIGADVYLPEGGAEEVPQAHPSVASGVGYSLSLGGGLTASGVYASRGAAVRSRM